MTLSHATGRVPIALADFDSIRHERNSFSSLLRSRTANSPALSDGGAHGNFRLRASENVGEGLFRWAPIARHIVAKWDFIVEND